MTWTGVVPAAGRGSRLGLDVPKLLVPVDGERSVLDVLRSVLEPSVDELAIVAAPHNAEQMRAALAGAPHVTVVVQEEPTGMGDAVFTAEPVFDGADALLVVWGDQALLTQRTIAAVVAAHGGRPRTVVIPLVRKDDPYVQYRLNDAGTTVERILETREGDVCDASGWGDVGTFALSREGLRDAWDAYRATAARGSRTGEANFLPFLVALGRAGWSVEPVFVDRAEEAIGINTPNDLEFCRRVFRERAGR